MRDILFRGKRIDNGEWVEGGYRHEKVGEYLTSVFIIEPLTSGVWEHHRVDPSTVGQYTGLTDKNGKRIFEGDVVKGWNTFHEREELYVIKHEGCSLYFFDDCDTPWNCEHIKDMEIIGNIHDNPELMKEENT